MASVRTFGANTPEFPPQDAFLSSTDSCCSEALRRWRDTRQQAAKALCCHAVDQALVNVRAIATKEPNT